MDPALFVRRNTAIAAPPLVPEIRLHLATEVTPIWQASEESLARGAVPPPFWAFAWAGGQALARYLLDHPETVAGRFVLDFGSGSGLVAIAAAKARRPLRARRRDRPFRRRRDRRQRRAERCRRGGDDRGCDRRRRPGWQVVTAGDVCYERDMADRVIPWLRALAGGGCLVLLGDPGRAYLPTEGLRTLASYTVPTSRELEDSDTRDGVVWQVLPP